MKKVREETLGGAILRLVETKDGLAGVVIKDDAMSKPIRGDDPDIIWAALEQQLDQSGRNYVGLDGAIARFLRVFPDGFKDTEFLAKERNYKVAATDFLRSELPLKVAMEPDEQACATAARAFGRTNLLSLFEQSRVREVLKGPDGPAFVKAAAGLAMGDLEALEQMATVLKPGGAATWPVMTYLPFFWSPGEHMFLKPTVTVEFAERIGHRFARDYGHEDRAAVYRSLITMKDQTNDALVALQPADGIDVQSFIWVVGAYDGPS